MPIQQTGKLEDEPLIIAAARLGGSEAFECLFRQYRSRIFSVATHYFAPGFDRDDLIQEATIGLFKAIRDFEGERGAFPAFVDLCVRRQVITCIKAATRKKHAALNLALSLDAPVFEDSPETLIALLPAPDFKQSENSYEKIEFINALRSRCSKLERGILSFYSSGYSFDEMARELGVHCKSIDNGVWRIKVKAKKLLSELG